MNLSDLIIFVETLIIGGFIGSLITIKIALNMENKKSKTADLQFTHTMDLGTSEYPEPTDFTETLIRDRNRRIHTV